MGTQGQGKTLGGTVIGIGFSKSAGFPLWANYTIKNAPYTRYDDIPTLMKARNAIVIFDELWRTMDSRKPKENVELTGWFNQTQKQNLVVIYTSQHISQIDVRVRRATDWLIFCDKKPAGIWFTFVDNHSGFIGRKFLLERPERFYKYYSRWEFLNALTN